MKKNRLQYYTRVVEVLDGQFIRLKKNNLFIGSENGQVSDSAVIDDHIEIDSIVKNRNGKIYCKCSKNIKKNSKVFVVIDELTRSDYMQQQSALFILKNCLTNNEVVNEKLDSKSSYFETLNKLTEFETVLLEQQVNLIIQNNEKLKFPSDILCFDTSSRVGVFKIISTENNRVTFLAGQRAINYFNKLILNSRNGNSNN